MRDSVTGEMGREREREGEANENEDITSPQDTFHVTYEEHKRKYVDTNT